MKLFGYYRSSTSYRLRIALSLKGLDFENIPVNLLASEQRDVAFKSRNPFASVPMLEAGGRDRAQSVAILEWLDEAYPEVPLLAGDAEQRFTTRELAYAIATELHAPLNLPVLQYLSTEFDQDKAAIKQWYHHWLAKTLVPLEARLEQLGSEDFLYEKPGLFEVMLVPQLYNARRFEFDLAQMPHMVRIDAACCALPSFMAAHPDVQSDNPQRK